MCRFKVPSLRLKLDCCTGHPQQEHETSHGSMSKTKWAVDGPDGTVLEVNGRKFGANDDGAPMLCSMYCRSMGRHAHIDWCRSDDPATCGGPEHEHISTPMQPHPRRAKDWISHSLYWKRTGTFLCDPVVSSLAVLRRTMIGFKGLFSSPELSLWVPNYLS